MKIGIWWSYSGSSSATLSSQAFNEESHGNRVKFSLMHIKASLAETNSDSSHTDGKKEPNCPKNPILIYKFIKIQAGIIFNLSKDSCDQSKTTCMRRDSFTKKIVIMELLEMDALGHLKYKLPFLQTFNFHEV